MRISDWSSDVCSSDLGGCSDRVASASTLGWAQAAAIPRGYRRRRDSTTSSAWLQHPQRVHIGFEDRLFLLMFLFLLLADRHDLLDQDRKSTRLNSSH